MHRRTLWLMLLAFFVAVLVVAPNFMWLSRSSAVVVNNSDETITVRINIVDSTDQTTVMVVAPGASEFLWLELFGEASLAVEVKNATGWQRYCQEYIENGMYRVEVTLRSRDEVTCHTDLPLLDRLLIRDWL